MESLKTKSTPVTPKKVNYPATSLTDSTLKPIPETPPSCCSASSPELRDDNDWQPSENSLPSSVNSSDSELIEEFATPPTKKRKISRRLRIKTKTFYPQENELKELRSTTKESSEKSEENTETNNKPDSGGSLEESQISSKSDSDEEYKPGMNVQTVYRPLNKQPAAKKNKHLPKSKSCRQMILSESEEEEDESKLSEFQLQRKRNIAAQQELLKMLNMDEAKKNFEDCFKGKHLPKRPIKPIRPPPRAKSERIHDKSGVQQKKQDEGNTSGTCASESDKSQDYTILKMSDVKYRPFDSQDFNDYFERLYEKLYSTEVAHTEIDFKTCSMEAFESKMASLTLKVEQTLKVLPDPISSLTVHPSRTAMLIAAGSKNGALALWNVNTIAGDWDDSNVMVLHPHNNNVSSITFSSHNENNMYSCSWDGTVRLGDLRHQTFQLLHVDNSIRPRPLHWITESSPQLIYAGQHGGYIVRIDTRLPHNEQQSFRYTVP
jgi:WD40 repeat protein